MPTSTGSESRCITKTSSSRRATSCRWTSGSNWPRLRGGDGVVVPAKAGTRSLVDRRAHFLDDFRPPGAVVADGFAELLGRLVARGVAHLDEALAHRGRLERHLHGVVHLLHD